MKANLELLPEVNLATSPRGHADRGQEQVPVSTDRPSIVRRLQTPEEEEIERVLARRRGAKVESTWFPSLLIGLVIMALILAAVVWSWLLL